MNVHLMDNGELGVIHNKRQFIIVMKGLFFGPYSLTKQNVQKIIDLLKEE